jgi:hypothetical protein
VKKLIVQCHAGRTMIVQEGASFYKDFVGINLLKLPQLGKKLHDRNDIDEVNIEMSHSSSNDDDWWVQIQLKMQSNNQNQRGEEDLPEIARTEEEQRHLFFLPNFTQVLRFDGGSGGYPGTAGMRMVLFDLEIWSRGLSNIRRPRRYECC